jgi:hypothetical protein
VALGPRRRAVGDRARAVTASQKLPPSDSVCCNRFSDPSTAEAVTTNLHTERTIRLHVTNDSVCCNRFSDPSTAEAVTTNLHAERTIRLHVTNDSVRWFRFSGPSATEAVTTNADSARR